MLNPEINIKELKIEYQNTNGIKFVVIDDLFDSEFARKCEDEFRLISEENFIHYKNPLFEFEKFALNDKEKMPSNLRKLFEYIHSQEFIEIVNQITSMENLLVDEKRWGGGLHMTKNGGYLSVHKDFNVLPTSYEDDKQMLRCVNLIGYLNSKWKDDDGGELEFWSEDGTRPVEKIKPKFNRWVLFDTRNNFHGHPYPYKGESPRISIASYYYIRTSTEDIDWTSTVYLKLPWMDESDEYIKERRERADSKLRYSEILRKKV